MQITMRSYVGRLLIALTGLVVPTTVLALLGWQVLAESQYRVERGRIANDIYTALLEFDLEKSALRSWSYRRTLDQPADSDERTARLDAMRAQISRITAKADLAAALDRERGKLLPEHEDRLSMLEFLKDVVAQLDLETQTLLTRGVLVSPQLSDIDTSFDQLRGTSSAQALRLALSAEAEALIRERERANQSLASARNWFLSAGGFGLIATFVMAVLLALRFREPFRVLDTGLQAYAQGDFSYRFRRFSDQEFVRLGTQLNAMATEVELSRQRAAENREHLEQTVALRTGELQRALDELSASEGARQRLLADIGHELRTPITAIRGEAQVALRMTEAKVQPYRDALARIIDVSRQMGRLINDLLVLVRDPQKGQPDIKLRKTGLADVVLLALDVALPLSRQRDVALQVPIPMPDRAIVADPDRLGQVVICLLDNALRYSYAGGSVVLRIKNDVPGMVVVEIADQGIGLGAEDIPHVFDRGWRADAARAHRPDGLGLGLAIAQHLTWAQGGQLTLEKGDHGQGAVARLAMPTGDEVQSRGK